MNWMRCLDKLICLLVSLPPLYMFYRFVRWYVRSDEEPEQIDTEPVS